MRWTASRWIPALLIGIPCVVHNAAALAQTPEEQKAWEAQRAQAQAEERVKAEKLAKQREARRADPMAWVRTLDPMSQGGWVFRAAGADGSWAAFSTEHQFKRAGHLVTAWLRQEYPEPQRTGGGDLYSSDVEKVQYDCTKEQARVMLVIYYTENNLAGSQQSEQAELKQLPWDPIVPGTQSEFIFHWACSAGSTGPRPG
jgi:hypothetical protein